MRAEPAIGPANTMDAPVRGLTWSTFPAAKSRTHKALVTGLKASPSMCGDAFAIVTFLTISPFGEITKSTALPVSAPFVLKPKLGT